MRPVIPASKELRARMQAIRNTPPPTLEEVDQQFKAAAEFCKQPDYPSADREEKTPAKPSV